MPATKPKAKWHWGKGAVKTHLAKWVWERQLNDNYSIWKCAICGRTGYGKET